jgi:hypothetical protein
VSFSKKKGIILKEKVKNLYKTLEKLAEKEGVISALLFYAKSVSAKIYLSKLASLKKSLYKHMELMMSKRKMESSEALIPALGDFSLKLNNWKLIEHYLRKGMGKQGLILVGPSNTNKTLLARSIGAALVNEFKEIGKSAEYLFVTELDQLKDFNKDVHKMLILDDVNLKSLPKEQLVHLLASSTESVDIRCRHSNVTLPPYVPRVITTNNIRNIIKAGHEEELLRLCYIAYIEDPMLNATGEDFYRLDESVVEVYPLNLINSVTNNIKNNIVGNNNTVNNINIINVTLSSDCIKTSN